MMICPVCPPPLIPFLTQGLPVPHILFETKPREDHFKRDKKKAILGFWIFKIVFENSLQRQQSLEKGLLILKALLMNTKSARP